MNHIDIKLKLYSLLIIYAKCFSAIDVSNLLTTPQTEKKVFQIIYGIQKNIWNHDIPWKTIKQLMRNYFIPLQNYLQLIHYKLYMHDFGFSTHPSYTYSRTSPYGHLSLRTPLYYGQFHMFQQNSNIFSLKKESIIRTLSNTDNGH